MYFAFEAAEMLQSLETEKLKQQWVELGEPGQELYLYLLKKEKEHLEKKAEGGKECDD